MTMTQQPDVVTLGGRFGWALTRALAQKYPGWQFLFVMRDPVKVDEARTTGIVDRFFGDKARESGKEDLLEKIRFSGNVSFITLSEFNDSFRGRIKKLFIPAVSSNALRWVLTEMLAKGVQPSCFKRCETLAVSKGMENATLKLSHEVIDEILGSASVVALGGNLAFDCTLGDPMLMELAGPRQGTGRIAGYFSGSNLVICQTRNRRKLSLAGPMKNIHSLATGMASEIYGKSTVSAIATLGLAEYEQAAFIVQFPETLRKFAANIQKIPFHFRSVPIAGGAMSDYHLFRFTRNFDAGREFVREIIKGNGPEESMAIISRGNTVESFSSASPTREFLKRLGSKAPVIDRMAAVLKGRLSPESGIDRILNQNNLLSS